MNDWIAQKGSGCVRDSDDPDLVVLQRLGLFEIFGLPIHHPYVRIGHVENLTAGALENARENRRLVFQQKGAKRDGENQPEILSAIPGQHSQSYEVHGKASIVIVYR